MARRRKYKVGDRIFFECFDGTVGTDIVLDIEPRSYNDDDKQVDYYWLVTYKSKNVTCGCEDYNTLPYSDPRVKALMKELHKQDVLAEEIRDWVKAKQKNTPDYYSKETIANALAQVAKEYGWQDE